MQDRVFIRHQRSENSPFNSHNSLTFTFRSLWFFYSDMEPLSKYSPVMLDLSPATIILNENPAREGEGDWKATLQLSPSFNASCPSHKTVITKEYPSFGEWIHHRGSGLIPTSKMALKQWQRQLKWWKMVQKQDWSCISDKYHHLYYYMTNFFNLIGLEQLYFSLIWNTYMWILQTFCGE